MKAEFKEKFDKFQKGDIVDILFIRDKKFCLVKTADDSAIALDYKCFEILLDDEFGSKSIVAYKKERPERKAALADLFAYAAAIRQITPLEDWYGETLDAYFDENEFIACYGQFSIDGLDYKQLLLNTCIGRECLRIREEWLKTAKRVNAG